MYIFSTLWLLPIVFMLHDFEEIIMMRSWLDRNSGQLRERFPRVANLLLDRVAGLSTSAFALAVAEEFLLISLLTLLCVEFHWLELWVGMLMAFFLHLLMHAGQYIAFRHYNPAILTVIPAALYCLYAIWQLSGIHPPDLTAAALWTVSALIVMVANLAFAHWLAARFDQWLASSQTVLK